MSRDQLPEGYKQTEVGVIPEDWEVKCLKHISPSQSVGLVINPSSYFDHEGSVPMLVGSQISENRINWELANRISSASNELLPASRLTTGDLVTVRVGNPGVTAVVPPELDGCNCASMMIVRQHASFSSLWLCYVMNSRIGRSQIEHVQYGTAQKQFNISDAIDFTYPVPPLPEQRSIAQALSDADALIAALERAIAKKRAIKTATMQQLLTGKKRLPGFGEGKGYQQTAIGLMPEDWEVCALQRFWSVTDCKHITAKFVESGFPVASIKEVQSRFVNLNNAKQTTEYYYKHLTEGGRKPLPGDLILSRNATVGEVAQVADWHPLFAMGQDVCLIRKNSPNFSTPFLQSVVLSWLILRQLEDLMVGSTFRRVNVEQIKNLVVPMPQPEEQRAIATVLSDMDAEIAALETRLAKTQSIKQGMMQQLLTGKVRLKLRQA